MSHAKVVAVYDTLAHAEAAVSTLKSAGYPESDISVVRNDSSGSKTDLGEPGFWKRLFGSEIGTHEAGAYGRTVLQGGVVVTVRVPESETSKIIKLLDSYKQLADVMDRARMANLSSSAAPNVMVPPPTSAADFRKDEEVVPLAEEQLIVGKRQVDGGKSRVRRFSVEKPVEAGVTLHEEVTETLERPVVNKTVRVTEEVVIRRKSTDHVETVHDTVRRQQLAVEKVPLETVKK